MGSDINKNHAILRSSASWSNIKLKVIFGTATLTFVYALSHYAANHLAFFPPPAVEFCRISDGEKCTRRPDLFAFQMGSGVAIFYVAYLSVLTWYQFKQSGSIPAATCEDRIFGYQEYAHKIAIGNFIFQVWDFFISLFIEEHCNSVMLSHHIFAALTAWFCVKNQVLFYYGVFYLGITEVSSVFLVFVDLGKFFPPLEGSWYHLIVEMSKVCFAVSFIWFRIINWFFVSFKMYLDIFKILKNDNNSEGSFSQLRPGKKYILYYYLTGAIAFGLLQLYWLTAIFGETMKFFIVKLNM